MTEGDIYGGKEEEGGKYEVEEEEEEEEEERKGPGGKGLKLPRKKWISYGFGSLGVRQFGAPLKSACQNSPSARRRPLLDVHSNTRLQLQYLQLPAWKYVGDLWLNRHYSYCLSYRSINPSHSSTFFSLFTYLTASDACSSPPISRLHAKSPVPERPEFSGFTMHSEAWMMVSPGYRVIPTVRCPLRLLSVPVS